MSNFKEFFIDYGEFHDNTVNKIIHIICVPQLVFSIGGLLQPIPGADVLLLLIVCVMSIRADLVCGGLTAAWCTLMLFWVRHLYSVGISTGTTTDVYWFFIYQNLIGWIVQIIGHELFEKRTPPFLSNFILSLSAPFFVTAEVLKLFGWRKDEFRQIRIDIDSRIRAFREGQNKTRAN